MSTLKTCIAALLILPYLGAYATRSVRAGVVISAIESEGNVELTYSGTLDLSELSFTSSNPTSDFHELSLYESGRGSFINAFVTEDQGVFFADPFLSEPGVGWLERSITADEFSGDQLVLLPSDLPTPLRVHAPDLSSNIWSGSGSMQFNSTTITELGLDLSTDLIWTINNSSADTIRFTAIPEPNSYALVFLALARLAAGRYRLIDQTAVKIKKRASCQQNLR